jgi:hypothetical protein
MVILSVDAVAPFAHIPIRLSVTTSLWVIDLAKLAANDTD